VLEATGTKPHRKRESQAVPLFTSEKAMSAQRLDEAPKLDGRLGSGTVAVISIPLAFRRPAASAVHAADFPASDSGRTARLSSPF